MKNKLVKALVEIGLTKTFAEGRRLILSDAIKVNGSTVEDLNFEVETNDCIKVGNKDRQITYQKIIPDKQP